MPHEHRHLGPGKSQALSINQDIKIDIFNPRQWTDQEIEHIFDTRPNITLAQLSDITGKPIEDLKATLMPGT